MARQTKRGICELCGAHTNVGMNHGSAACPACTHVQTALNKRPEAVAKAIRAMHKTEELLGHLIPAGGGIAVKVTADLLQEISGIVGYDGEDPAELVEAVRRRVLTCASCDAEDVLREIREIVGYSADMGDSGLADAVRAFEDRRPVGAPDCTECDAAEALLEIAELVGKRGASSGLVVEAVRKVVDDMVDFKARAYNADKKAAAYREDCADCTALRGDLLRACGLDLDEPQADVVWDTAVAGAIQEIADLTDRNIFLHDRRESLLESLAIARQEAGHVREKLREALEANDSMVHEISSVKNMVGIGESQLAKLRSQLTLAQQSRDEWKQRAVQAESNVETLEAALQERDRDEDRSFNRLGLLDIAIAALRGDAVPADQIAGLLAIARKVSA